MKERNVPIMLTFKDLASAWVEVNGVQAKVYGMKQIENKISGAIESTDGAPFVITYRQESKVKPLTDLAYELYIDGNRIPGKIGRKSSTMWSKPLTDASRIHSFKGARISQNQERPFQFAKPKLTDDDNLACQEESIIKNLGTIQVKVYRGTAGVRSKPSDDKCSSTPKETVIHEQVKKASLSHQVGYGESFASPKGSTADFDYLDPKYSPYRIFEFSYMSRALLEVNGFIQPKEQEAPQRPIASTSAAVSVGSLPSPLSVSQPKVKPDKELSADELALAKLEAAAQVLRQKIELAELDVAAQALRAKIATRKRLSDVQGVGSDEKKVKVENNGEGSSSGSSKVKKEKDERNLGQIVLSDSD